MPSAYIIAAARTPQGKLLGSLSDCSAPQLASHAISSLVKTQLVTNIDQVILGNVVSAGIGQAPARQAATLAGLPSSVGAVTINKVCGSGLFSVMLADMAIRAGEYSSVIAGGMESMSRAPHLLMGSRAGHKYGPAELADALDIDGLICAQQNESMGRVAEQLARRLSIRREAQDSWAMQSHQRAVAAAQSGRFNQEIIPIPVSRGKERLIINRDEAPRPSSTLESLGRLPPAFTSKGEAPGTVTAGNASSLADGAAAVTVVDEATLRDLKPAWTFRIVGHITTAGPHADIFTAPAQAVSALLHKTGRSLANVDLLEINEAFAVQMIACVRQLNADESKVNVHGGAIALGHPLGASGARVLVTLIHALLAREQSVGIAALCLGGGEAVAMMIERVQS